MFCNTARFLWRPDECATETYGTKPIPQGKAPEAGKIGFRTRYCNSTQEPTLPRHAWTLNMDAVDGATDDSYRYNPWRAPGFAPVVDPCGQARRAKSAPRSLRRALLMPQVNAGSLYRCGQRTFKEQPVGYGRRKGG